MHVLDSRMYSHTQGDRTEMDYWLGVLGAQIPTVVEKAMASEGATSGAPSPPRGRDHMHEAQIYLTESQPALISNAWTAA